MGFTIICNKCGTKRELKDEKICDFESGGVDINVSQWLGDVGTASIEIKCTKCGQTIDDYE